MTLVSQGSILLPSDPDHIMEAQDRQQLLPASSQSAAASAAAEQSAGRGRPESSAAAAAADTPCADVMTDLLLPRSLLVSLPDGGVASPASDAMASIAFSGEPASAAASATGSAIEEVSVSAADVPSGARRDWQKPEVDVDRLSLRSLHGHSQKAAAAALSTAGFAASYVSAPGHSPLLLPRLGNRASAAAAVAGDFVTASSSFVGHEPLDVVHQRDCGGELASGSVGLAGPGCCLLAATPSFDLAAPKALLECAKVSYQPLPAANGWPLEAAAAGAAAAATSAGNGVLTLPRVADGLSSDEGSGGESNDYEGASVFQGASKQRSGDGCLPAECDSAGADDADAACFFAAHERHMHAKSANERQAVRLIIDDIRRALSKPPTDSLSLGTSSRSLPSQPGSEDADTDVWVIRDSYSEKLRRQDELRRARIETERRYEEEFRRKQAEEVYYLEHEDSKLMTHQQQQQQHGNTGDQQVDGAATPHTVRSAKPTGDGGVVPQREATAEGSAEYSEHDRDIAGNWFVKKGKYRPVVASDSDSDGREDVSSSATSAIAASSVFLHRQAAGVQRVCHAARLADYRGRTGSRCGDEEPRSAVAAEPTRTQAASHASDADGGRGSSAAAATSGSGGGSRGGRSKLMQEHRMSQQLEGRSARSPQAAAHGQSCSGSSGASDGSGCGDDDCNDAADDADDDQDGGGGGSEHREQQQRHLQRQHRSTASADRRGHGADYDTDDETDRLVQNEYRSTDGGSVHIPEREAEDVRQLAKRNKAKEVAVYDPDDPTVLIEGILFRASYLGSTQLVSEMQPSKAMRMMQAQEAVGRIKAPEGESQPSTEVDLFVSTEKVMVLNTNLKEIIMDHSLRSISYIADIENVLVVMAKRSVVASPGDDASRSKKQQKLICHVFDTEEAQLIAKSIGQAFQVAYMEFLKANGIDDPGLLKETTYEDILNQQEIAHDELDMFTRRDMQKEVAISKARGEALGIVVVESGWGSMLPTVVLANMSALGPATRSGQLNIGDQIMAVNGVSLVGLPLSTCQDHIKGVKSQTVVKLTVVSRPPVVDVLIKRPDIKYQLGFSVQNGVICSLLRGGIAERGGIRVGHRIIEINGQSVVATSHEKIVYMLSTLIGEIRMKTMPMSIFRLLTGQELPHYI